MAVCTRSAGCECCCAATGASCSKPLHHSLPGSTGCKIFLSCASCASSSRQSVLVCRSCTFTRLCQRYCESPTIYNSYLKQSLDPLELTSGSALLQYADDLLVCSPTREQCEVGTVAQGFCCNENCTALPSNSGVSRPTDFRFVARTWRQTSTCCIFLR